MYGQALLGALLGVTPFSLRLTSALVGIATVAATFGLARAWFDRRAGLLASGLLAVAFWHVVLSRVGLRAIMAPLFYVLVFWTLSEALRGTRRWPYALAGALLGLAQYSYISARLLPAILLVVCLILLWHYRTAGRPVLPVFRGLCLAAASAALVALPEALYFLRHPDSLVGRTDQVLVFSAHPAIIGTPITFQQSLERTLDMFWVRGDTNWLHNVAGLPVLDFPLTVLFLLGCAVCAWWLIQGVRRPPSDGAAGVGSGVRAGLWPELWLLVWCLALLAGSSITQESPNYLRLTALMPAVAILCARGADWGACALTRLLPARVHRAAATVASLLLAAFVVGEGVRTTTLFFDDWASQPGVYTAFDTDIHDAAAASRRVTAIPMADTVVQLDASAPFLYFRPESAGARWAREYTTVLPLPPAGQPGLWIYAHFQQTPPLPSYLPQARRVAQGDASANHPGYFLYELDAVSLDQFRAQFRPPDQPASFGGQLALRGISVETPDDIRPGTPVTVSLLWQVLTDQSANFGASVHLEDGGGVTWAQSDQQGMLRDGWRAGDEFVSRHVLQMPADLPPVPLRIVASAELLDPESQPAAILEPLGAPVAVGTVHVLPASAGSIAPPAGAHLLIPGLYLTGTELSAPSLRAGDALRATLRWLRTASVQPVSVALLYVDSRGQMVARVAGDIGYGALPPVQLPEGVIVADPRRATLPARTAPGPLALVVVVTDRASGRELTRLPVGTVQVQDRPHQYTIPPVQRTVSAIFGDQIALLGYDRSGGTLSARQSLTLTLYWQALRTPDRDDTVFVHLLDAQGNIVAQHDSQPGNGSLPTGGWLPREVITDPHRIVPASALSPGTYHLEVGLYDASTGKRLPMGPGDATDHLVLPDTITVR